MITKLTKSLLTLLLCLAGASVFSQTKLTGIVLGEPGNAQWGQNKAFDDDITTFFDVGGDIGNNHGWVGLELASPKVINKVRFYPRVDGTATWPVEKNIGGKFQGANTADFASPVTLATLTTQPPIAAWTELTVTNTNSFKYVRYLAPDLSVNTTGVTTSNCTVGEIQFYSSTPDTVPGTPAAKIVYIPAEWNNTSLNIPVDLTNRSRQSANFLLVWGPLAGNNPQTATDVNLRFNPQSVLDSMENIYNFYIQNLHVLEEKGNLAKYKMIIVMNNTWSSTLYTGWAFGGGFDNVIGAMFVDPRSMSENGWVVSHEMNHSFQYMVPILYPGHGFTDVTHGGFFWETHANFMAIQRYPGFITATDYPRAMNFTNYYIGSPRKHYGDWYILQYLKDREGLDFVSRIWRESNQPQKEHPMETVRRLLAFNQTQMNDMMLNYAMKRVKGDFSNKTQIQAAEASIEKQYVWKKTTILDSLSTGHYAIADRLAPQQYGFNIIRLYPQTEANCPDKYVYLNFKGHTEVNNTAGWRYGFVSVAAGGATTFGAVLQGNIEVAYKVPTGSTELYLVVMGAPTTYQLHNNFFEVGFPKLYRYPYEINIKGALPEGYQPGFRHESLPAGANHSNGGGFVASTATVASTAYVGPKAVVLGTAQVTGTARIEGKAMVRDNARVSGNAVVSDFAIVALNANVNTNGKVTEQGQVYSGTTVAGSAIVKGNAVLFNNNLSGTALIYGNALSMGADSFSGTIQVGGDAEIGGTCAAGRYLQMPGLTSAATTTPRGTCDGVINHELNVDVNAAYTAFTNAQIAFAHNYSCGIETNALLRSSSNTSAEESLLSVKNVLSPNGDGKNDILQIERIENFPENKVSILNANGVEIFKKDNYNNINIVFDGRDRSGIKLPTGTYFYLIKVKSNGRWETVKGHFALGY